MQGVVNMKKRRMRCVAHCVDGMTFNHIQKVCYEMYPRRKETAYQNTDGKYSMYYNLTSSELFRLTLIACRRMEAMKK